MNTTSADPPWLFDLYSIVQATRSRNIDPRSLFVLVTITVFYACAGTRLDLLYNVAIVAYLNCSTSIFCISRTVRYGSATLVYLLGVAAGYLALASRPNPSKTWKGPAQPYLIPCRTTHTRLFPKKHSFSYSYLTVGVPVDYDGTANGMIEIDEALKSRFWSIAHFTKTFTRSWYYIQPSDHFQRGHGELSLRQKLDNFLQSERVNPKDYPHAYLITAPKFLGYHFNPVSFWYLYSPSKILSAMVLEVNNTFDERRPYLVLRDFTTNPPAPDTRSRIKGSRVKGFHVSPFNSRNGIYSVLASDPLGPGMVGFEGIDVKITLSSSKGHSKLVARLFSEGEAIDPASLNAWSRIIFVARWSWVGFATLPRIVKEAAVLLFRRKLRMFDTPNPLTGALGRRATSVEKTLEVCFRRYLEDMVHRCEHRLRLKYYPSGVLAETETIFTSRHGVDTGDADVLELRVLTPAFYSRFIHYVDSLAGLEAEMNEYKTISINKPELMSNILTSKSGEYQPASLLDAIFTYLVGKLRQSSSRTPSASTSKNDFADINLSSMDTYMLSAKDTISKRQYMWASLQQMVADRFLGGRVDMLSRLMDVFRIAMAYIAASQFGYMLDLNR